MQQLKHAAAVFCIACICAEAAAQLLDEGWPRRCIKAAAGLYILVVLARVLPGQLPRGQTAALPPLSAQSAPLGSLEDAVLLTAQQQLAAALEAQCAEETGLELRLEITLAQAGSQVEAVRVRYRLPAGSTAAQREQAAGFLRRALGTEPELESGEGGT